MAPHTKKRQGTRFQYDGETVTERSLGMSLMNQMFPEQEPTSEAEIELQHNDPIAAIILAAAEVPATQPSATPTHSSSTTRPKKSSCVGSSPTT